MYSSTANNCFLLKIFFCQYQSFHEENIMENVLNLTAHKSYRELIDIDQIEFNKSEIKLLSVLYKAYKENDKLGIFGEDLRSIEQSTIDSLVNRKFIAYAQDILSLTIFGYNYCANKK